MSIELATTQPVQQAGAPRPPGAPNADQLGLTLRERMWLARAALATMAISAVSFGVLLTQLPVEHAKKVVATMPNAQGLWLEGGGHVFPMPEMDTVTQRILRHLSLNSVQRPEGSK